LPPRPTVGVAAVVRACLVLRGDVELPGAHLGRPRAMTHAGPRACGVGAGAVERAAAAVGPSDNPYSNALKDTYDYICLLLSAFE
jgi:hypothetical protein